MVILKIYDGSGTHYIGDGSLLHTIVGSEIMAHGVVDELNVIDESYFRIVNEGRYDSIYNRHDDGTTLGDIWRVYDDTGELILSGVITEVEKSNNETELIIKAKEWTQVLTRRIVENEVFTDKKGDYILTNATYGLIPKYLSTYNINVSTYVDTPSNIIKQKYNGQSVYDCAVDCAAQSYGAGSKQFQFSIFEVDSAGSFTKYLWFKERESGSVAKTFYYWDIVPGTMQMSPSTLPLKNRIIIEGDVISGYTPANKDSWTESSLSDWSCPADNTLSLNSDSVIGNNSVQSLADAGSFIARAELNLGGSKKITRSTKYPAKKHILDFYLKSHYTTLDSINIILLLVDINSVLESHWIRFDIPTDKWSRYSINLNDVMPEWNETSSFKAACVDDVSTPPYVRVDNLFFDTPESAKYIKSPASQPYIDHYIKDFNLKSNIECQKVAEGLYEYRKTADRYGQFQLKRPIADIKSGDSVAVKYPPRGIDISSMIVRRVEWSGARGSDSQTVFVGRKYTQAEILQAIQQKIDKK